jgi:hypothetical protein
VARKPAVRRRFDEVVPCLTVTQSQDEAVLEEAEAALLAGLPVTSHVPAVDLLVHDGTPWPAGLLPPGTAVAPARSRRPPRSAGGRRDRSTSRLSLRSR